MNCSAGKVLLDLKQPFLEPPFEFWLAPSRCSSTGAARFCLVAICQSMLLLSRTNNWDFRAVRNWILRFSKSTGGRNRRDSGRSLGQSGARNSVGMAGRVVGVPSIAALLRAVSLSECPPTVSGRVRLQSLIVQTLKRPSNESLQVGLRLCDGRIFSLTPFRDSQTTVPKPSWKSTWQNSNFHHTCEDESPKVI